MTQTREDEGLELLGNQQVSYPTDYAPEMLETFQNKHPENDYFVKFNCPEFTSLCPITGQPDFATIYISYVPDVRMVESKSLKLYLFSFRNHGDFHEDCMNIIMKDLIALMDPKYIEVWGKFTPRGGILQLRASRHSLGGSGLDAPVPARPIPRESGQPLGAVRLAAERRLKACEELPGRCRGKLPRRRRAAVTECELYAKIPSELRKRTHVR